MRRFTLAPDAIADGRVTFDVSQSRHLARVLRLRAGDTVVATDGAGHDYTVRLDVVAARVSGTVVGESAGHAESPLTITLVQGVPKGDKMDAIVRAATELGVLMQTNLSWSIDDSRNKFQFGCEYGRMIRGGKLAEVVRNPNYRGVSATFWRSLAMVGDGTTVEVMGTPYCGKGEPNQAVRVGHASPPCRFTGVDVFGGER